MLSCTRSANPLSSCRSLAVLCVLVLPGVVACDASCPDLDEGSVDAVPIDGATPDQESTIRAALAGFLGWTDRSVCVTGVGVDTPGAGRVGLDLSPAERPLREGVFHGLCTVLDRESSISVEHPEVFTGVGIDPTLWRTEEARRTEDFARTCARAPTSDAWVRVALETCGGEVSDEARWMVDFFDGEAAGFGMAPRQEQPLSSIVVPTVNGLWGRAVSGDRIAFAWRRYEEEPDRQTDGWAMGVWDLQSGVRGWVSDFDAVDPAIDDGSDIELFSGPDALLAHDLVTGAVWRVGELGLQPLAPVSPGWVNGQLIWDGAGGSDGGWVYLTLGVDPQRAWDYDPDTGLGAERSWTGAARVYGGRAGMWRVLGDAIEQPRTGRRVEMPCCGSVGSPSGGRVSGATFDPTLSARVGFVTDGAADRWVIEQVRCAEEPSMTVVSGLDQRVGYLRSSVPGDAEGLDHLALELFLID